MMFSKTVQVCECSEPFFPLLPFLQHLNISQVPLIGWRLHLNLRILFLLEMKRSSKCCSNLPLTTAPDGTPLTTVIIPNTIEHNTKHWTHHSKSCDAGYLLMQTYSNATKHILMGAHFRQRVQHAAGDKTENKKIALDSVLKAATKDYLQNPFIRQLFSWLII